MRFFHFLFPSQAWEKIHAKWEVKTLLLNGCSGTGGGGGSGGGSGGKQSKEEAVAAAPVSSAGAMAMSEPSVSTKVNKKQVVTQVRARACVCVGGRGARVGRCC